VRQRRASRLSRSLAAVATAALACAAATHADTFPELDDAASRAQYAFYTADTRALEEVLALMTELEIPANMTAMKEYYLGYGQWKLAQLHAERAKIAPASVRARDPAMAPAQSCMKHAQAAVKLAPRMAEAHALEAVCSMMQVLHSGATRSATTGSCLRGKPMRTAAELEPNNPRVKLLEALCSGMGAQDPAWIEKIRTVVAAFEAAPVSRPGVPDWGQAEALSLLGQAYLQRGDTLAARDALEHALVLAPDYRQAQTLLQTAASRPR
jgi:tetratricopeptide (TPR) repeat protein